MEEHYKEANTLVSKTDASEAEAAELIKEFSGYLDKMDAANTPSTSDPVTKTATLAIIQDQTTVGSEEEYDGSEYNITVNVTLSDGKITGVSATSTAGKKDAKYFAYLTDKFYNAFKGITSTDNDAIDKVNTGADAISGATYSAATVKQAVKNALSK